MCSNHPESKVMNDPTAAIITDFIYPPIPIRDFDWLATRDGYEPGDLFGIGPTEAEAIANLLEQEADQ